MCGLVPGDFGLDSYPFIWNGMARCYICKYCNLELAVEFYEEESRYFDMASRLLGVDFWECKKLYLEYVVSCSVTQLTKETGKKVVEYLTERVDMCKRQIEAIEQYFSIKRSSNDELELHNAFCELKKALVEPAFDIDFVLPNLISIEVD